MKTKNYMFLTLLLVWSFALLATTYYVRATGDDSNDGLTPETAVLTLRQALDKASTDGDVINISGTVNFHKAVVSMKTIVKDITIQGEDKATSVVVGTVTNGSRSMEIGNISTSPTVLIENLTFKDFDASGSASGNVIDFTRGTFTCRNVNFENNIARFGGAIEIRNPHLVEGANTVLIQDCYFKNNSALKTAIDATARGGAIYIYTAASTVNNPLNLTIDRCTFDANYSETDGSALFFMISASDYQKQVLVQNCTFANNANKNGGLNADQNAGFGAVVVRNNGTGTFNNEVKFINNTIAFNQNERNGFPPGFYNNGYLNLTVINNIFYGNTHPGGTQSFRTTVNLVESRNNLADIVQSDGGLNIATAFSGNTENISGTDLKLATSLADNGGETTTLSIATGSIAHDAGYVTGAPEVDQRGSSRVGNPDIGAYELGGTFSTVNDTYNNSEYKSNFFLVKEGLISNVDGTVQIYTIEGKCVKSGLVKEGQLINLRSGIYVIHLITENSKSVQKVLL
jgi:hypothetical protein